MWSFAICAETQAQSKDHNGTDFESSRVSRNARPEDFLAFQPTSLSRDAREIFSKRRMSLPALTHRIRLWHGQPR